ncbi:uncharacterized protein LOC134829280 [Culicoides brevitarsis]|uniref:uncharacterized protein LOC134829280 n=1 Tax=Culicoides brevitarsis TaxID=469753 RepID=UPI00307BF41C
MSEEQAENHKNPTKIPEIKSFAFFDIETTGLPSEEGNRTKITEISIVACSVEHFLSTKSPKIPRVLHKLTLCVNPCKRISYKSEEITGLSNDLLEHERKFDKETAETLKNFLSHLQSPCALVAHNGFNFDFPILKRMLELNDANLGDSLLAADSLHVFREIDELEQELAMTQFVDPEEKAIDDFIIEELLSIKRQEKQKASSSRLRNGSKSPENAREMQEMNETTPEKQILSTNELSCLQKLPKLERERDDVTPETSKNPQEWNKNNKRTRDCPPKSRRDLFGAKKSFKLTKIYENIFQTEPEHSHYAEADVITLLKCAIAKNFDFVRVVQEQAKYFKDIPALGQHTKM